MRTSNLANYVIFDSHKEVCSMHVHLVIQYQFAKAAVNVSIAVLFTSETSAFSSSTCLKVSITNKLNNLPEGINN